MLGQGLRQAAHLEEIVAEHLAEISLGGLEVASVNVRLTFKLLLV